MGNSAPSKLRPPESSLNPILRAQAHSTHSKPFEQKTIRRVPTSKEPSMAALLGYAIWCHGKVDGWSKQARSRVPTRHSSSETLQHSRVLLALLLFLARACHLERYSARTLQVASAGRDQQGQPAILGQSRRVGKGQGAPGRTKGSSKYRGLSWHKGVGKWAVQLRINGANQQLGYYADEEKAARVYDSWVIRTRPADALTNFPRPPQGGTYDDTEIAPTVSLQRKASRQGNLEVSSRKVGGRVNAHSDFRGVTFDKVSGRWRAQVWLFSKAKNLGSYNSEHEAALAYDRALIDNGIMNRGFNLPAAADKYLSQTSERDYSSKVVAKRRRGRDWDLAESLERVPQKRLRAVQGESSRSNSRVGGGGFGRGSATATSPQQQWETMSPASSEQRSTPESEGFSVPVERETTAHASGGISDPSLTRFPVRRPMSPSPAPELDALASLCDAEAGEAEAFNGHFQPTDSSRPQPTGLLAGDITIRGFLASHKGPLSPRKLAAASSHAVDAGIKAAAGDVPVPVPRMRQRKPEKRKRVETEPEPEPAPEPAARGRGRRGRGRGRGRGRWGAAARGISGALATVGDSSGKRASKFRGIIWSDRHQQWHARFWQEGQIHHVGYFNNEEAAARAFDAAAIEAGAAVTLNFPLTSRAEAAAPPRSRSRAASPGRPMTRRAAEGKEDPDYEPSSRGRRDGSRDASEPPMQRRDEQPGVIGPAALEKFKRMLGKADGDIGAASGSEEDDRDLFRHSRGGRARGRGRCRLSRQADAREGMGFGRVEKMSRQADVHEGMGSRDVEDGSRRRGRPSKQRRPKYRGVSWEEETQMWIAELRHLGKNYFINRYKTKLEASKAYDRVGVEKFGPNFPVNHRRAGSAPSSSSESESETSETELLPPLPRWGYRLPLATVHPLPHGQQRAPGHGQVLNRSQPRPQEPAPSLRGRQQQFPQSRNTSSAGPRKVLHQHAVPPLPSARSQSAAMQPGLLQRRAPSPITISNVSVASVLGTSFSAPQQPPSGVTTERRHPLSQQLPGPKFSAPKQEAPTSTAERRQPVFGQLLAGGPTRLVPTADGKLQLENEASMAGAQSQEVPLRLVQSGNELQLMTTDPKISSAILAALNQQIGLATGTQPAQPQTDAGLTRLLTLPERAKSRLERKRRAGETLKLADLLDILKDPPTSPPPSGSQGPAAPRRAGQPLASADGSTALIADLAHQQQGSHAPPLSATLRASQVALTMRNHASQVASQSMTPVSQGVSWDDATIKAADLQRSLQLSTAKMMAEANRNAYTQLITERQAKAQAATDIVGTATGTMMPPAVRMTSQAAVSMTGIGKVGRGDQQLRKSISGAGLAQGTLLSSKHSGSTIRTSSKVSGLALPANPADKPPTGQRTGFILPHQDLPQQIFPAASGASTATLTGGWERSNGSGVLQSTLSGHRVLGSQALSSQAEAAGNPLQRVSSAGKPGMPPTAPKAGTTSPPNRISSRKDAGKDTESLRNLAFSNTQDLANPRLSGFGRFNSSYLSGNRIVLGSNGVLLPRALHPTDTLRVATPTEGPPRNSSPAPAQNAALPDTLSAWKAEGTALPSPGVSAEALEQRSSQGHSVAFENGRWKADIGGKEGSLPLPPYGTQREAAKAYDIALQRHGEDMKLDVPRSSSAPQAVIDLDEEDALAALEGLQAGPARAPPSQDIPPDDHQPGGLPQSPVPEPAAIARRPRSAQQRIVPMRASPGRERAENPAERSVHAAAELPPFSERDRRVEPSGRAAKEPGAQCTSADAGAVSASTDAGRGKPASDTARHDDGSLQDIPQPGALGNSSTVDASQGDQQQGTTDIRLSAVEGSHAARTDGGGSAVGAEHGADSQETASDKRIRGRLEVGPEGQSKDLSCLAAPPTSAPCVENGNAEHKGKEASKPLQPLGSVFELLDSK